MKNSLPCPACRKENPLESLAPCPRCETDLKDLRNILRTAQRELEFGTAALHKQDWHRAVKHADKAWKLHHCQQAAELGVLAAIAGTPLSTDVWLKRQHSSSSD
jgi:hypothetical protein